MQTRLTRLRNTTSGANIATAMVVKILEMRSTPGASSEASSVADALPLPVALNFAYPALSFHFTSWMPSSDLRVLRSESRSDIGSLLLRQKDHLEHRSPLAVVEDIEPARVKRPKFTRRRTTSGDAGRVGRRSSGWGSWIRSSSGAKDEAEAAIPGSKSFSTLTLGGRRGSLGGSGTIESALLGRDEGDEGDSSPDESDKALEDRVLWWDDNPSLARRYPAGQTAAGASVRPTQSELRRQVKEDEALVKDAVSARSGGSKSGETDAKALALQKENDSDMLVETRLAMTSRTAFFNGEPGRFVLGFLPGSWPADPSMADASLRSHYLAVHGADDSYPRPLHHGIDRLLLAGSSHGAALRRTAQCAGPALGLPLVAHLYAEPHARAVPPSLHVVWRTRPSRRRREHSATVPFAGRSLTRPLA